MAPGNSTPCIIAFLPHNKHLIDDLISHFVHQKTQSLNSLSKTTQLGGGSKEEHPGVSAYGDIFSHLAWTSSKNKLINPNEGAGEHEKFLLIPKL
jgi:hypothetical protein